MCTLKHSTRLLKYSNLNCTLTCIIAKFTVNLITKESHEIHTTSHSVQQNPLVLKQQLQFPNTVLNSVITVLCIIPVFL